MSSTLKCNLVIPGFAKSGTSSLYKYLALHPDICMSQPKEPHFFDVTRNWQRGADWYNSFFQDGGRARSWYGDASPNYAVWEPALEKIKAHLREPRLIVLLRHPVGRLISHYNWLWAYGVESRPLLKALEAEKGQKLDPDGPVPPGFEDWISAVGNYAAYRAGSHYSYYCPFMESLYGRERILYLDSKELSSEPQAAVNRCCRFLGLSDIPLPDMIRDNSTESIRLQRKFGLDLLFKPLSKKFRDRIDPGGRMRAWVRNLLGKRKRKPPEITATDKEELRQVLADDITFYEALFPPPQKESSLQPNSQPAQQR